ncbi:MAG: kelch repeat-containing protein [Polyangiaceae bacterium]
MFERSLLASLFAAILGSVAAFGGCGSDDDTTPHGAAAQGGAAGHGGEGGSGAIDEPGGAGGEPYTGGAPSWSWTSASDLPEPRQSAACVALPDSIYVFGGMTLTDGGGAAIDSVVRYDPVADAWSERAPLPAPNCCFAAARLGDRVYVAGGYEQDTVPTATFLSYDPVGDEWAVLPDMPTPRSLASAVVWGDKLAVIGGRGTDGDVVGVIELYDPATHTWETSPIEESIAREAAAVVNGSFGLVVAGGYPSMSAYGTNEVEVYADGAWSDGPAMLLARGQLAWGVLAGRVVLAGGWGPSGHTDFVEAWLPGSPAWEELPPLSVPRAGACAAKLDDALYVIGGGAYQGGGGWQSMPTVDVLHAD